MHPMPELIACDLEAELFHAWHVSPHRTARRSAVLLSLGLYGLRRVEIQNLLRQHHDRVGRSLYVPTAKHGIPRRLLLDGAFSDAIATVIDERLGSVYVFPGTTTGPIALRTLNHIGDNWLSPYGPYTLHSLRHTAAVRLYTATRDVLAVQRFLGHTTLAVTTRYLCSVIPDNTPAQPRWQHVSAVRPNRPRRGRPRKLSTTSDVPTRFVSSLGGPLDE